MSVRVVPHCDSPEQAGSAENAWLIPFAGIVGGSLLNRHPDAAQRADRVVLSIMEPALSRCLRSSPALMKLQSFTAPAFSPMIHGVRLARVPRA